MGRREDYKGRGTLYNIFMPFFFWINQYLNFLSIDTDGDPVVCGEGDGEEGHGHQAKYRRKRQGHSTTEPHGYIVSCLSFCFILLW